MKTRNALEQKFLEQATIVMQNKTVLDAKEILTFSMLTLHYKRKNRENNGECAAIWKQIDDYISPMALVAGDEILNLLLKVKPFMVDIDTMSDFLTVSIYGCKNQPLWRKADEYLLSMKEEMIKKGTSLFCLPEYIAEEIENRRLRRTKIFCTKAEIEKKVVNAGKTLQQRQWCLDNFDALSLQQQEEAKRIILGC